MIKKIIIGLVLSVWAACAAQAAVNIAVIAPKSGDFNDAAQDLMSGARAAVAEINAKGGLLGQRINLVEIDDRCDNTFNLSMAQMMAVNKTPEDKFSMIIGPYCRNEFATVSALYARAQILQIMPQPLGGEDWLPRHSGLLKLGGKSSEQANEFFEYYQLNFSNQNVAVVYDSAKRSSVEISALVQQKFAQEALANRMTGYNFANYGKDYSLMAKEIMLNNQVVYILGASKEVAKLTRELKEIRPTAVVFTDRYLLRENYFEIVNPEQEGLYFLAPESLKDNPQFAETLVNLRLQGEEPKGLGVYGYLSVKLWKELVLKAKSFNYNTVTAQASTVQLPWGNVKFENGNPDRSAPYGIYRFRNGEYAQVY